MCMVKTKNRGGIDHSADFAHQSFTDGISDLEFSLTVGEEYRDLLYSALQVW